MLQWYKRMTTESRRGGVVDVMCVCVCKDDTQNQGEREKLKRERERERDTNDVKQSKISARERIKAMRKMERVSVRKASSGGFACC